MLRRHHPTPTSHATVLDPEWRAQSADRHELRNAWINYLQEIPWHHIFTLTFRDPATEDRAKWAFGKFIRRLERHGSPVWWCYVPEVGWAGKRLHLHGLLGGTRYESSRTIEEAWWAGDFVKIDRFDPARGGIPYITKSLLWRTVDVEVSKKIQRTIRRWEGRKGGSPRWRSRWDRM